jgi:FKBP-type peptidyl-prolyl cis-trans isomerase
MTRKHLTGLLLAATTMTAGTLAVTNAQDAAEAAAEEKHGHEHTPTTVHAGDETAFKLDDEKAYPDPDGFETMHDRISYAIGRTDGRQIPMSQPDMDPKVYGEGIRKGLSEENEDYALGYSQGFEITRRFLAQRPEDEELDMDAFVDGIAAALKEESETRAIGYLIGNSYREAELSIKADSYLQGVDEGLEAGKPAEEPEEGEEPKPAPKLKLTDEQVQETLQAFQAYLEEKQQQETIQEGKDYIDGLKEEDGWKKTESGIAYKVVKAGEGNSPDENDIVTMNYEGSLIDGTVFDSSYRSGQPLVYPANQLIPGWTEILQMMKPGAEYQVVIPYDLAYGETGSRSIPPYATLKFKMEMIGFEPVEAPKPKELPAPVKPGE